MTARRYVVMATWNVATEQDAREVRDTLAGLGSDAEVQTLWFDGERLVSVDPPGAAPALVQDLADVVTGERARAAYDERLTDAIRAVPVRPSLSRGWQDRVFRSGDEARLREAATAVLSQDFAFSRFQETAQAKVSDLNRWGFAIAERLRDPHYATGPAVEVHPVEGGPWGKLAIRALGVEIVWP